MFHLSSNLTVKYSSKLPLPTPTIYTCLMTHKFFDQLFFLIIHFLPSFLPSSIGSSVIIKIYLFIYRLNWINDGYIARKKKKIITRLNCQ